MAVVAVAGCDISEDFKQALDEFRSAGQQEDTVAETEVEVVAGVAIKNRKPGGRSRKGCMLGR